MAKQRATTNNIIIQGQTYKRGQFIPGELPELTPISSKAQEHIWRQIEHGHPDPTAESDWNVSCEEIFEHPAWQQYLNSGPRIRKAWDELVNSRTVSEDERTDFLESYGCANAAQPKKRRRSSSGDNTDNSTVLLETLKQAEQRTKDSATKMLDVFKHHLGDDASILGSGVGQGLQEDRFDSMYEGMMGCLQSCDHPVSLSNPEPPMRVWQRSSEANQEDGVQASKKVLSDYIEDNKAGIMAGYVMFGEDSANNPRQHRKLVAAAQEWAAASADETKQRQETNVGVLVDGLDIDLTSSLATDVPATVDDAERLLRQFEQSNTSPKIQANHLVLAYKQAKRYGHHPSGWQGALAEGYASQVEGTKSRWGAISAKLLLNQAEKKKSRYKAKQQGIISDYYC